MLLGRVYALKLGGIWFRVLVENNLVFYVNAGLYVIMSGREWIFIFCLAGLFIFLNN